VLETASNHTRRLGSGNYQQIRLGFFWVDDRLRWGLHLNHCFGHDQQVRLGFWHD
jgi:hypothetical protein